jgi:hypothetical protein
MLEAIETSHTQRLPKGFGAALPGHHLDAALVLLATEFCDLQAVYARLCWAEDPRDHREGKAAALAMCKAFCLRSELLAGLIVKVTPATLAGYRAKALAVSAYYNGAFHAIGSGDAIMWSLVAALIGEAA